MLARGLVAFVGSLVSLPAIASAGRHHDHDSAPTVRDHRSHDSEPTVRDHRSHEAPVVRDHRSERSEPVVRDHREGDVYYAPAVGEEVYVNDGSGAAPIELHAPTWVFEFGGFASQFRGKAMSRSGNLALTDGSSASYGLESGSPSAGDTAAGAFGMRFLLPTSEHTYAGAELAFGKITRTPVELMTDADVYLSSKVMVDTAAVVGVRARHGLAELDGEVAGGLRVLSMTVKQPGANDEEDAVATESSLAPLVETRLRGVLWLAPHVFAAAQVGVGVLDRSDMNVGFSLGLASRPYARMRTP